MNCARRLSAIEKFLSEQNIDCFFVTNEVNVSYLSGFRRSESMLMLTRKGRFFITDFRYQEEAEASLEGFELTLVDKSTYSTVAGLAGRLDLKTIGFESMDLPSGALTELRSAVSGAQFVPLKGTVESLRVIKDEGETALMKKAVKIAGSVYSKAVKKLGAPGMTEDRLRQEIEASFINKGSRAAFCPIVAVGPNSSRPHAASGKRKIGPNSVVLIDLGGVFSGYNSDLTRTTLLGRIPPEVERVYAIVEEARRRAIANIRPGVKISDVDLAARRYIQERGYGKHFGHSLGHGIGMEVHEFPTISQHNDDLLAENMVFTVEPAIYVPGLCGIRIEDMILVTKAGCEVLS
ncbi:M24 family metallopeptidase [Candidatus Omnitrophota bacterium]